MNVVSLEKLKFAIESYISPEMMHYIENISIDERYMRQLTVAIRGFVWAEKDALKHQEIKYPYDWWQAFKERWFPAWLLKRYPVQYHVVVLDVRALYPEIKFKMPEKNPVLMVQRSDYDLPLRYDDPTS